MIKILERKFIITNEKEYLEMFNYYKNKGYKSVVQNFMDTQIFKKKDYSETCMHLLLLIATGWFSLGVTNIIYLIISYYIRTQKIILVKQKASITKKKENNSQYNLKKRKEYYSIFKNGE